MTAQQAKPKGAKPANRKMADESPDSPPRIPEREIKQNSGVSASLALQAMQKAWELRQAANAAGDPDAREEILAKAINKEIEAESFGKAAKYTRSGTFQGLAAGAGLGVQPGVTLGKLTGALVGGVVSTVTGLLGGGIGAVYGAMNGPFWDLGEMASHGVRSIIGDFPNWKSTPAQKRALEKMIMQTKETQAPTKEELEQMKAEAPDDMPQSWSQSAKDMTSWRPSMPSMPSMPKGAALGLGGLGASMPSWGGRKTNDAQQKNTDQPKQQTQSRSQQASQVENQQPKTNNEQSSKQEGPQPREAAKPKEPPTPKEAPTLNEKRPQDDLPSEKRSKPQATPKPKSNTPKSKTTPLKEAPKPQTANKPSTSVQPKQGLPDDNNENKRKSAVAADTEKRKPRKLATKSSNAQPSQEPTPRRTPRKLESRKPVA
ncbi:hypothetical protein BKA66DRAFT_77336 [Pyrenochaeta sp. MPI-SDFR-AT-0127]|nr:hypothetical protein BKA66DRAFT_77336 [Pyrenochaeta sp. MPI-SDFR-AT-0127]